MKHERDVVEVAQLYDQLAANGPYGTLAPGNRGGRKSRYVAEVFDAALLPEISGGPQGRPVLLDYGCGTGIFTVQSIPRVDRAYGLDISEQMLRIARELDPAGRIEWLQGDGRRIPLPDAQVDIIVARESLCYVPTNDLPGVVAEIARVLRPGGRFLWLEQTTDDPRFQSHPGAPLLEKRSVDALLAIGASAGLVLLASRCVRTPRFPWIYPIWAGVVPLALLPLLARWEVAWHRRFGALRGRRWRDVLLVFEKPGA
ncbi:MAG: hypothetical protein CL625_00410 [Arenimonas sp.]|jgi:SAM-dependent methyltransferase|nr:hypothetical protein [Arenimonas sp.]